jgi:hypothetical protein
VRRELCAGLLPDCPEHLQNQIIAHPRLVWARPPNLKLRGIKVFLLLFLQKKKILFFL